MKLASKTLLIDQAVRPETVALMMQMYGTALPREPRKVPPPEEPRKVSRVSGVGSIIDVEA